MAVWQSVNAATPGRMLFDAGALYRNYGEGASEDLIGATRGGASFTVDRDDREIEVDGVHGPVKGLRRTIRLTAKLEVTFVEFSLNTWRDLLRGDAASDGTHFTITPGLQIFDTDYYTNIALVAEVGVESDPCIIKLLDAMITGEWDITTNDNDEGEISVTFEAHFDPADLDTIPYTIEWPVAAS